MIFLSQYILQLLGCSGGGGAATNIKVCNPSHKILWNINGCVVLFLPLTPYLIHPTLLLRCPPSPTARMSRTRSRRSHFLFFITGTCRHPLLHHWKTLLLSSACDMAKYFKSMLIYFHKPEASENKARE